MKAENEETLSLGEIWRVFITCAIYRSELFSVLSHVNATEYARNKLYVARLITTLSIFEITVTSVFRYGPKNEL